MKVCAARRGGLDYPVGTGRRRTVKMLEHDSTVVIVKQTTGTVALSASAEGIQGVLTIAGA